MYRITYHPKEGDSQETKVGAFTFKAGEPVLVDEQNHSTPWTLMENPWFTVENVSEKPLLMSFTNPMEKDNA